LAMVAVLVMGLAGTVSAFAAPKKKMPVVTAVSPASGWNSGGATVTITGKNFKQHGKSIVRKVMFDQTPATRVQVTSATSITATAPAGKGRVNVRVFTRTGKSARVAADKFKYIVPVATQMALNAGDKQTASLGAAVKIAPSVIVKDAKNDPVAGTTVTFAVATGGGSVTGASAVTNAAGIATAGSWTLGTTAGANTLTATSAGLSGSPVTFTATGDPGILLVQHNGTPVRAYSLAELQALTPFVGWAGLYKNPAIGPDAVTGAKVVDIVKDALGTALATGQSVNVAEVDSTPYNKTMTYDLLVNFAGISMYDATTRVLNASPAGPLASVLIYSDPAGLVMTAASGPLRFVVADTTNENLVFGPTNLSVSKVNQLNVITP
jgi:hypothetical protein